MLLLVISMSSPAFAVRFVAYCFPAIALLAGAALDALGWLAGTAALIAIVLAGLPLQLAERAPSGHGSDIRLVDQIIAAHRRPGDAVLYGTLAAQYRQFAYPYGLASLRDVSLLQTPAEAGNLTGTTVDGTVLYQRLATVSRLWLYGGGPDAQAIDLGIAQRAGFRPVQVWHVGGTPVELCARPPHRRRPAPADRRRDAAPGIGQHNMTKLEALASRLVVATTGQPPHHHSGLGLFQHPPQGPSSTRQMRVTAPVAHHISG